MKIVVLDAATLGEDLSLSPLDSIGETVVYQTTTPNQVPERIKDADVLIINKIKLNESNLMCAESLKLICVAATGYDNIDTTYCREHGIAVSNVMGYSTHSVAQLTLSMVLSLYTHIPEYRNFVRSGEYTRSSVANRLIPVYHELYGKTWGVIGLGNIGRQVARVAKAFGCRILAFKRTDDAEFECVSLEKLCKESDIISIHLPLSEKTRNIIDKKCISYMKRDAVLVNVSRGAVTDEGAIAEAVENGEIGAFATDVYSEEPFTSEHPFTKIMHRDNVLLTPHMAWGAYESRERCLAEIIENIKAFNNSQRRNRVD